jgi:hypothetical protein
MEDVTNNLRNIGKPLAEQEFDIRITYRELTAIRALAQNPHPAYMEQPGNQPIFSEIFEDLKTIANVAETRETRRIEREERASQLKRYMEQFNRHDPFD